MAKNEEFYTAMEELFRLARASPTKSANDVLAAYAEANARAEYIVVQTRSKGGRESTDIFTADQWKRFMEVYVDGDEAVPYHTTRKEVIYWEELDTTIIDDQAEIAMILLVCDIISSNILSALPPGFFDEKKAKPTPKVAKRAQ
jgi:hypothetical protein